jgi:hypothetical protein
LSLAKIKIGQVVIFLTHFLLIYQKHYFKKGKLPKDARLIGQKETITVYQEGEKIPPAAPPNNSLEDGKVFYGHRNSMTLGLMNTDWAKKNHWRLWKNTLLIQLLLQQILQMSLLKVLWSILQILQTSLLEV